MRKQNVVEKFGFVMRLVLSGKNLYFTGKIINATICSGFQFRWRKFAMKGAGICFVCEVSTLCLPNVVIRCRRPVKFIVMSMLKL